MFNFFVFILKQPVEPILGNYRTFTIPPILDLSNAKAARLISAKEIITGDQTQDEEALDGAEATKISQQTKGTNFDRSFEKAHVKVSRPDNRHLLAQPRQLQAQKPTPEEHQTAAPVEVPPSEPGKSTPPAVPAENLDVYGSRPTEIAYSSMSTYSLPVLKSRPLPAGVDPANIPLYIKCVLFFLLVFFKFNNN